jgi:uncharacterized membrane protein
MKIVWRNILLLLFLSMIPVAIFAQPGNPSPGTITGGLIFLLLGGVSLGIVKLRKKH